MSYISLRYPACGTGSFVVLGWRLLCALILFSETAGGIFVASLAVGLLPKGPSRREWWRESIGSVWPSHSFVSCVLSIIYFKSLRGLTLDLSWEGGRDFVNTEGFASYIPVLACQNAVLEIYALLHVS